MVNTLCDYVKHYTYYKTVSQMAALELHDIEGPISNEAIQKAIEGLESPLQKVRVTINLTCAWLLH